MSERVRQHTVRRDVDGNPICNRCNTPIEDENYHFRMYHPDFPSIPIGPLHEKCIPFVKLCSICHKPCSLYEQGSEMEDEIQYVSNRKWICLDCIGHISVCSLCRSEEHKDKLLLMDDGQKLCRRCVESNTFHCNVCNKRHYNSSHVREECGEDILLANSACIEHYSGDLCVEGFERVRVNFKTNPIYTCKCCLRVSKGKSRSGYCPNCRRSKKVLICNHCKNYSHITFSTTLADGEKVITCGSCIKTGYVCMDCGEFLPLSKFKSFEKPAEFSGYTPFPHHYKFDTPCITCIKNYIQCPTCFTMVKEVQENGKIKHCRHCFPRLNFCDSCGKPHLEELVCRPNTHILNYSYKPFTFFKISEKEVFNDKMIFMGIENEVTFNSSADSIRARRNITANFNATELYIKSDSSIHGTGGFEIVTSPMSYEYIKSVDWDALLFSPNKFVKSCSCGMHIHINKKSFVSIGHLFKFTKFFNTWDTLRTVIAGRNNVGYAKKIENNIAAICLKKENTLRYSIVNHCPSHTVEVRIFAGAITAKEFKERIEFTHAVHQFSRNASNMSTETDFVQWLVLKSKEYPNLKSFFTKKGE